MKLRKNLVATFRAATPAEYEVLSNAAAARAKLDREERPFFETPAEADLSLGGAVLWSAFVLWQDHPTFVCCGCAGLAISTGLQIVALFA